MQEAEIKFKREELSGVIPVGTYLFDAARRMGAEVECERTGETDDCAMKVTRGGEFLSEITKAEIEQLSDERRRGGERLACQAKIERVGEIEIMTTEKKEEEKPDYEAKREAYRKEFEELPLEKKIASLVELEAIALGDTFSFIINSPYKLVGKFMDVLAEFGLKMDEEAKKQTRPAEHRNGDGEPSVKEENHDDDEPSIKEETLNADDNKPSVSEDNTDEKTAGGEKAEEEPPAPSV